MKRLNQKNETWQIRGVSVPIPIKPGGGASARRAVAWEKIPENDKFSRSALCSLIERWNALCTISHHGDDATKKNERTKRERERK